MRKAFVPVKIVVTCTPYGTLRRVLQLLPSNTLLMCSFEVSLLPLLPALFLCGLDSFGSAAACLSSVCPELRSKRLFLDCAVLFSLGTPAFVPLLRLAPPLRSFNMVVERALSFAVRRVVQVVLIPR